MERLLPVAIITLIALIGIVLILLFNNKKNARLTAPCILLVIVGCIISLLVYFNHEFVQTWSPLQIIIIWLLAIIVLCAAIAAIYLAYREVRDATDEEESPEELGEADEDMAGKADSDISFVLASEKEGVPVKKEIPEEAVYYQKPVVQESVGEDRILPSVEETVYPEVPVMPAEAETIQEESFEEPTSVQRPVYEAFTEAVSEKAPLDEAAAYVQTEEEPGIAEAVAEEYQEEFPAQQEDFFAQEEELPSFAEDFVQDEEPFSEGLDEASENVFMETEPMAEEETVEEAVAEQEPDSEPAEPEISREEKIRMTADKMFGEGCYKMAASLYEQCAEYPKMLDCLIRSGDYGNAKQKAEHLLAEYPDSKDAVRIRLLLKQIERKI